MSQEPEIEVIKVNYHVPLTGELLADNGGLRDAIERALRTPTPVERGQYETWRAARARRRAEQREAAPAAPPVTLERLAVRLGFGPRYTEHLMEQYCGCEVVADSGWERCEHAIDLGIEESM